MAASRLPKPPNSACLPPGLFEQDQLPTELEDLDTTYETLYELWDPKHTEQSLEGVIFKTSTIDVPVLQDLDRTTESFKVQFLRLAKDNLRCPWTMLVRREYDHFIDIVEKAYDGHTGDRGGRIILGHPGIGKTVFLNYFLVKRLIAQQNTYVIKHSEPANHEFYYSFTAHGFKKFTEKRQFVRYLKEMGLTREKGVLLLDTNTLVERGIPFFPGGHIWHVLISSPTRSRFKEWKSQNSPLSLWMHPWSWQEIYATCRAMLVSNIERLVDVYAVFGPSIRKVTDALTDGDLAAFLQEHNDTIDSALKELKAQGYRHLMNAVQLISSGRSSSHTHFASDIFVPRPVLGDKNVSRVHAYLDVLTYDIAIRLLATLGNSMEEEQQLTISILSSNPHSATTGGVAFEAWYIRLLRRMLDIGREFRITSIRCLVDALAGSRTEEHPFNLVIPSNAVVHVSENLAKFRDLFPSSGSFVLIPENRNQSPWDFVIRVGDTLYLIQVTTSSSRSVLITSLDDIRELTRDSPLADINDWKLVFVVPHDVAPSWSTEMEITNGSGIGNRRQDVSEYQGLRQYVCGMNVAETYTTAPGLQVGVNPGPSNTTPRLIVAAKPEFPAAGTSAGSTALGERRSEMVSRQLESNEGKGKTRSSPGPSSTTLKRKADHDKDDKGTRRVRRK